MMKKLLPILIILAFVAFCYQIIVTFFITEHEMTYSLIASDQRHYTISEEYEYVKGRHYYSFVIKNKKKYYNTLVEEDFDKQDRVITDIKHYKKNNLECILPVYKRDYTYDALCLLDGEQVTPYSLIAIGNQDFVDISKKFAGDGYEEIFYKNNIKPERENGLSIYYDYIPEDFVFAVWNYRGIDIIDSKNLEEKYLLNEDHYENNLSTVAGKYYITVNTDNEEKQLGYYQLILYNLQDGGKSLIDVNLSQDSYFNGVYDKKLYITDPKEEKQYVLDPLKKEFTELNHPKEIVHSSLKKAGSDFYDSIKVDDGVVLNKKITKLYDTTDIKRNRDEFYFKTKDGKIYQVIQKDYKHPVLLFQQDAIKEWQAHDDGVSFIVDDTLYFYSSFYGLKPVLVNPEFKYNSKNIYHFIRKD